MLAELDAHGFPADTDIFHGKVERWILRANKGKSLLEPAKEASLEPQFSLSSLSRGLLHEPAVDKLEWPAGSASVVACKERSGRARACVTAAGSRATASGMTDRHPSSKKGVLRRDQAHQWSHTNSSGDRCASIRSRASLFSAAITCCTRRASMSAYLEVASQVLVLIFVLTTLFSVGLLVSMRQVLGGLQQRRSLALALCANFVVLPGAALALCWALQLTPPIQAALLLVATAPGSPALLRLNEFARGDQARAVGLLVVLTSLTVAYQPLVLPDVAPGP